MVAAAGLAPAAEVELSFDVVVAVLGLAAPRLLDSAPVVAVVFLIVEVVLLMVVVVVEEVFALAAAVVVVKVVLLAVTLLKTSADNI